MRSSLTGLVGVHGRPFIDLTPFVDTSAFDELHEELCQGLALVRTTVTGGSHKWMGIVPPHVAADPYADYGLVISRFSREEFIRFVQLADDPTAFDLDRWREYSFGEDTSVPLSEAQIRWLEYRYGVYFPWRVMYSLGLRDVFWDQKHEGLSDLSEEAQELFPRTCAFVRALPFVSFGRCDVLGLGANDHATIHRDGLWVGPDGDVRHEKSTKAHGRDPTQGTDGLPRKREPDQFITFAPGPKKRLFLWDERAQAKTYVTPRVYWFNDCDYHGVEADPYFRYSIRVDGRFSPELLAKLRP